MPSVSASIAYRNNATKPAAVVALIERMCRPSRFQHRMLTPARHRCAHPRDGRAGKQPQKLRHGQPCAVRWLRISGRRWPVPAGSPVLKAAPPAARVAAVERKRRRDVGAFMGGVLCAQSAWVMNPILMVRVRAGAEVDASPRLAFHVHE
jgi:hypothetical protein